MPASKLVRTKALVIDHRTRLKEKDIIVRLLCDDGSQRSAIAKGALKPGGKLAGKVELACVCDFLLAQGKNLDIVQEAQSVWIASKLRFDMDAFSLACAELELMRYVSHEDISDPFLFAICARALVSCERIHTQGQAALELAAYVLKVLSHEGYKPIFEHCCVCGEKSLMYFSPSAGGALCEVCASSMEHLQEFELNTQKLMAYALYATFDDMDIKDFDTPIAWKLAHIAYLWATYHLDVPLRAYEFFLGV